MPDISNLRPSKYLLYVRKCTCRKCGQEYTSQELMAIFPAKNGHTAHAVQSFEWNVPVGITTLNETSIPACTACISSISLSHLPTSAEIDRWEETIQREAKKIQAEKLARLAKEEKKNYNPSFDINSIELDL